MSVLSFGQLETLWNQAGGPPSAAPVAAAIAEAESSGRTDALNDNPATGDYSVGPWQINYFGSLRPGRTAQFGSPEQLLASPLRDARAAVSISNQGANFNPWTTYTSGAYRGFLPGGVAQTGPGAVSPGASGLGLQGQVAGANPTVDTSSSSDGGGIVGGVTGSIREALLRLAEVIAGAFVLYLALKQAGNVFARR